jgi:hypothetical protein
MKVLRITLVLCITIFSLFSCIKTKNQETSISNNISTGVVENNLVNKGYDNISNENDVNSDSDINEIISYMFEYGDDKTHMDIDVSNLEDYYPEHQDPNNTIRLDTSIEAILNDDNINIRKFPSVSSEQLCQISRKDMQRMGISVKYKSDCFITIENVNYRWYYCFFDLNNGIYFGYGWICGKYIDIENENEVPVLKTINVNGIDQHPAYYFSDFPYGIVKENIYNDVIIKALLSRISQEDGSIIHFSENVIYKVRNITDMDLFHVKMMEKISGVSSYTERQFPNYNFLDFGTFQAENGERMVMKMTFKDNLLIDFWIVTL